MQIEQIPTRAGTREALGTEIMPSARHRLILIALLGVAAAASSRSFPALRWWEKGGVIVRGVWPKCALGEFAFQFKRIQVHSKCIAAEWFT